ncbi:MAG: hypothetical protein KatS3mg047_0770 [Bellilinea sp.]|nr:MAG: hypothetical protein KatS3mg047_0770 [Bellilinea sp.]
MRFLPQRINHIIVFVFFAPFALYLIPLLEGKVIFWGTAGLQFIPWRAYGFALISQGVFPFWNPLNGMGAPLFANYQTAFLYPLSWILYPFYLFGGTPALAWGFTLLVPVHLGIAGIGMALFLRKIGVNPRGQIIGALAFSLCGYFVARASFFSMIWAGVWLPWLLLAIEGVVSSEQFLQKWRWMIGIGLIGVNQLLAGHAQLTWYSFVFSGLWVILRVAKFRNWKVKLENATLIFMGFVLAFLLASVQLVPTLEYLSQSQRSSAVNYEYAVNYSLWPWRLLGFFLPDLFGNPGTGNYWGFGAYWEDAIYIGLLPVLLALNSIISHFRVKPTTDFEFEKRRLVVFLWAVIIVVLILSLGKNTPVFPWLYHNIPTFDMFQAPTRWMFLAVFALAILAGLEAHSWCYPSAAGIKRFRLMIAASIAIGVGAVAAGFLLPQIEKTFIRSFLTFGALLFLFSVLALYTPRDGAPTFRKQTLWNSLVVGIVMVDLWLAGAFTNPFIDAQFFEDPSPSSKSLERFERTYIPSSVENRLKFEKYLIFRDFNANLNWDEVKLLPLPNINMLAGIPMVNNFDPLVPSRFDQWMNWMDNLSYEELKGYLERNAVGNIIVLRENLDWGIVTLNPRARISWSGCQRVDNFNEDIQKLMVLQPLVYSNSGECIIVEAEDQCNVKPEIIEKSATIEVQRDEVNLIEVAVNAVSTGWVRIADSWYPGWKATIDGHRASVERVDYLFKGVCVPAGKHTLILQYQPTAFPHVVWISLGTLLFCLVSLVFPIKVREMQSVQRSHK